MVALRFMLINGGLSFMFYIMRGKGWLVGLEGVAHVSMLVNGGVSFMLYKSRGKGFPAVDLKEKRGKGWLVELIDRRDASLDLCPAMSNV